MRKLCLLPATLRFGSFTLGQQADMWLAIARPNLLRLRSANFTYPRNVRRNRGLRRN